MKVDFDLSPTEKKKGIVISYFRETIPYSAQDLFLDLSSEINPSIDGTWMSHTQSKHFTCFTL